MTKEQEGQIAALIRVGCAANREEAIQILREDDDESYITDEMREAEKRAKAIRKNARAVNAYGKEVKRERKPNEDKREIIQTLDEALCDLVDNVTVVNEERTIDFEYNGVHYSVTLTAHRPPKDK